jgi:hypothetical protein
MIKLKSLANFLYRRNLPEEAGLIRFVIAQEAEPNDNESIDPEVEELKKLYEYIKTLSIGSVVREIKTGKKCVKITSNLQSNRTVTLSDGRTKTSDHNGLDMGKCDSKEEYFVYPMLPGLVTGFLSDPGGFGSYRKVKSEYDEITSDDGKTRRYHITTTYGHMKEKSFHKNTAEKAEEKVFSVKELMGDTQGKSFHRKGIVLKPSEYNIKSISSEYLRALGISTDSSSSITVDEKEIRNVFSLILEINNENALIKNATGGANIRTTAPILLKLPEYGKIYDNSFNYKKIDRSLISSLINSESVTVGLDDPIGVLGSTGGVTGPHVHVECRAKVMVTYDDEENSSTDVEEYNFLLDPATIMGV